MKMAAFCDMIGNYRDQEKFEAIYQMYRRAMYGLAYSITKNRDDAEDVVQISMVKVARVLYRIPRDEIEEPSCRGFLAAITRNSAIDYLRRSKNNPVPVENFRNVGLPSTEEQYIKGEELQVLVQYIGELPENYREVLRLRVLNQLSAKETADILSTSPANVNTMLGRARKKLHEKLEEYRNGEDYCILASNVNR